MLVPILELWTWMTLCNSKNTTCVSDPAVYTKLKTGL